MGAEVMAKEQRVRASGKYNKKRAVKGTAPKCLGAVLCGLFFVFAIV